MTAIELGDKLKKIRENTIFGNKVLEFQKFCIKHGDIIGDMGSIDIYSMLDISGYKYSYVSEVKKFVKLSKHVKLI